MPRGLLVLLMALLLALRGLLGSAMAMENVPPPAPAPMLHTANADGHAAHCHDGASTPLDDPAAAPCAACDICHTALLLPALAAQASPVAAAAPRAWPGAAFASAPLTPAFKPPIA